jgi:hypothetical protein
LREKGTISYLSHDEKRFRQGGNNLNKRNNKSEAKPQIQRNNRKNEQPNQDLIS